MDVKNIQSNICEQIRTIENILNYHKYSPRINSKENNDRLNSLKKKYEEKFGEDRQYEALENIHLMAQPFLSDYTASGVLKQYEKNNRKTAAKKTN